MIDKTGSINRAMEALRLRIAQQTSLPGAGSAPSKTGPSPKEAVSCNESGSSQLSTLTSRLASIPNDDPLRRTRALRLFVEAVLADEFGNQFLLDPEFSALVVRVSDAIEADPQLATTIEQATHDLGVTTAPGR